MNEVRNVGASLPFQALSLPELFKWVPEAIPISTYLQHASPSPNTDGAQRTKNILSAIFSLLFPTIALFSPLGDGRPHRPLAGSLSLLTCPGGAQEFSTAQWRERPDILLEGADQFLKPEIPTLIRALFKSLPRSQNKWGWPSAHAGCCLGGGWSQSSRRSPDQHCSNLLSKP